MDVVDVVVDNVVRVASVDATILAGVSDAVVEG
jgi:hypothetical protein